jgi:hypothetical protein
MALHFKHGGAMSHTRAILPVRAASRAPVRTALALGSEANPEDRGEVRPLADDPE